MSVDLYLFINLSVAIILLLVSLVNIKVEGGKSIFLLSLGALFFYLPYMLGPFPQTEITERIGVAASFLGKTLVTTALFTFSLEYVFHPKKSYKIIMFSILVVPLITQMVYWKSIPALGTIFFLEIGNIIYRYSLVIATIGVLGHKRILLPHKRLEPHIFSILAGPFLFFIVQGISLLGMNWEWVEVLFSTAITISLIGFSYNIFVKKSTWGYLYKRTNVVEIMEDGWMILDSQNRIIDFNQAASEFVGVDKKEIFYEPITSIISDFPDSLNKLDYNQTFEMDRTIKVDDKYHYVNIRVSNLTNESESHPDRLVIWRDITKRKRAEDARQRARDEMFVLLNAISSAASQTTNVNEFLSDVIYQIISPFRSQIVFFLLIDETATQGDQDEYYLAAHLGLSNNDIKELKSLFSSKSFDKQLRDINHYLLLNNTKSINFPESLKNLEMVSFLTIPLIHKTGEDDKLLGGIFLGRKEEPGYKQDEITRLTILADQVAALIDSDRRRKLAITLLERQRLMRDIHDSVSQKLYGLVTLTEAAQATIEAKSKVDYDQVFSRIGENARQAVKELRLFLFQMQPINLEKEGLISVLHHRLAAVEGRADIKVKFLADEPITISRRKELALYYIAQEALNNVLRHARATSVKVTLKEGYKYITLEIKDDGCGFDLDNLKRGGMGLENIKERVKQENGKLKISSKPDKGTIISVKFTKTSS